MKIDNPFRPGAGHSPPYLAGREREKEEFQKLLEQQTVLQNMVLTGLRGVGKTVLLETFKPLAINEGWVWAGADLSESASVSEEKIATRLLTDLSVVTANVVVAQSEIKKIGFGARKEKVETRLTIEVLQSLFDRTPGLVADKLKAVLEAVSRILQAKMIFAYDEAQNMSDQADKEQYPLSVLLDVFQSIQRKGIPFMLVLTGLPTLFPKLVEARTYSERMFRIVFLNRLSPKDSRDAILKPIQASAIKLSPEAIDSIVDLSGGYPYFIQFICREVYDVFIQQKAKGLAASVPTEEITRKLDTDFFAGRWGRATDRQRELLAVIASLDDLEEEFTVQEVVERSRKKLEKGFSASHVNQMLSALANSGLVYKNRHGKYSFAVPLMGQFVRRQGLIT